MRNRHVTWDARLGFAGNRNRLVRFGYGVPYIEYGLTSYNQRTVEGYPIAGYWVHDPVPDGSGGYMAGPARVPGASMATREASLRNTFTILRRRQLYPPLDYKGGDNPPHQTEPRRRCCVASPCPST